MAASPDLIALAHDERTDLLALLRTLTPEQWQAPTLCAGWTVRDVVAHVISFDGLSPVGLLGTIARGRLSFPRMNDVALHRYAGHQPAQLIDLLARRLTPRGITATFGGAVGLTDALIHHQDIRRPLGLPRDVPAERTVPALDFALTAPTLPSRRHVEDLRLIATDANWAHGSTTAPRIDGPAEALLLAVAGRPAALSDLTGPGVAVLTARRG
ncbi:maleylpyruvate isomerase family mycothiol-dependent enzyme [Tersicoccus sp. Bi-70]|uniref:maleylpyruvate isomerase family mycothiol-dependent enzyme n=1 Tax=Tersicoccus sp. Bi-70 TaxID=1897634 RepID=UPI0009789FA8|nr:maleylpyruvate isomerase family mycothiol-dependent enzyme [Tersicoccus sp. Bi-70]OMH32985.1 DinB family protein [Tersicoccus sp. Bi-70]